MISKDNLITLPYTQIVKAPTSAIEEIASKFSFPDLDQIQKQLKLEASRAKKHQPDVYQIESSLLNEINNRWGVIFERLGYPKRE